MDDHKGLSLGQLLKDLRLAKGFSLRHVAEQTGISNPYLSQLENVQITKPSPHILHKLAKFYGVEYEYLMKKVGYFVPSRASGGARGHILATSAIKDLTSEEEEELLGYLGYLRSRKRKRAT